MRRPFATLAVAVVIAGVALVLTVEPPVVGGVVVFLGAELLAVGPLLSRRRTDGDGTLT